MDSKLAGGANPDRPRKPPPVTTRILSILTQNVCLPRTVARQHGGFKNDKPPDWGQSSAIVGRYGHRSLASCRTVDYLRMHPDLTASALGVPATASLATPTTHTPYAHTLRTRASRESILILLPTTNVLPNKQHHSFHNAFADQPAFLSALNL
jgi:hypothetical protein